jgi:phosphoenolpyruvate carboxylase
MSSVLQSSEQAIDSASIPHSVPYSKSDLFLRNRLKVVEDLWESVLRQECGQELVDLLQQMRSVNSAEGQATHFRESNVLQLIEKLDLNAAIRAARAFALYFQLINIVEQHYEQRDQQLAYAGSNDAGGRMFSKLPGQATDAPDRPRHREGPAQL